MPFEGETPAERMMLRREAQEASAEQAAQELLADEVATKPKKGKANTKWDTKWELWTVYELATACPERCTNTGHMKLSGSITRISTVVRKASPSSRRFTVTRLLCCRREGDCSRYHREAELH